MAKLKPLAFRYKSPAGEEMSFSSEVTVDQDGTFNVTVPDEIAETLRAIERSARQPFTLTRPAKNLRVSAMSLGAARTAVEAAMRDHLACEVVRERVILYGTDMRITYVVDEDRIVPNGSFAAPGHYEQGRARWRGTLNANSTADFYSVGLVAYVREKITYIRPTSTKVTYERVPDGEGEAVRKLNGFIGITHRNIAPGGQIKEMPYSDEAAAFFYDAMIAMCTLSHRIEGFFADPAKLAKAIEAKAPMLGIAPPEEA